MMDTPTQVNRNLREMEVERLSVDFKRRISELQLAILSGKLSEVELQEAGEKLTALRKELIVSLSSTMKEQTGRRVRSAEEKRQRPA